MSNSQVIPTDPEVTSNREVDRKAEIGDWNHDIGKQLAEQEGIEMTDPHWEVVDYLRNRYTEQGLPESAREVAMDLADLFSEQGGQRYLVKLFPNGVVTQGCRIAGVPVPLNNEDASFGTAF